MFNFDFFTPTEIKFGKEAEKETGKRSGKIMEPKGFFITAQALW